MAEISTNTAAEGRGPRLDDQSLSRRQIWGPLLAAMAPYRGWLAGGAVLALLTWGVGLSLLLTVGSVLLGGVTVLAWLLLRGAVLLRPLLRYGERVITHDATFRLLAAWRLHLFRRLEPLSPAQLQGQHSGDWLQRLTGDVDALDSLYLRLITPGLLALVAGITAVIGLGLWSPWAAAIGAGGLLLLAVGLPAWNLRQGAAPSAAWLHHTATLRTATVETVQGLRELLMSGALGPQQQAWQQTETQRYAVEAQLHRGQAWTAAWQQLVLGLGLLALIAAAAMWMPTATADGATATRYAPLLLALMGAAAVFEALAPLPLVCQQWGRTAAAARRLAAINHLTPAVRFVEAGATPRHGGVTFDRVAFRYRDDGPWVLHNLSFTVAAGEWVGIVGPSGVGKSTLWALLTRQWNPSAGEIRLGEVPLAALDEATVRRWIAVQDQTGHLLAGTVAENLRLAAPTATDGALWAALAVAQLAEFVRDLPEGLDTWLGAGGMAWSGGQQKRLMVARVVLSAAPVVVLDEPTESLDAVTEQALLTALAAALAGRTVFLISHRQAPLAVTGRVIALGDDGPCRESPPCPPSRQAD